MSEKLLILFVIFVDSFEMFLALLGINRNLLLTNKLKFHKNAFFNDKINLFAN